MKEKDVLPDNGPKHALFIALFDGRKAGKVVTKEELKAVIADEYGDNCIIVSDVSVYIIISYLRNTFQEFTPEYKIINRKGIGYDVIKNTEIKDESQLQ